MKSFLQSTEWSEFQKSLGRQTFAYSQNGLDAHVFKYDLPLRKSYLYIPHGPDFSVIEGGALGKSVALFVAWLRELAKKENSIFVKAEPLEKVTADILLGGSFSSTKHHINPRQTVIMDLSFSEDEFFQNMNSKTRYNIRHAKKMGVTVRELDDIDLFWAMLQKTTERDSFHAYPKSYYEKLLFYFKSKPGIQTRLFFAFVGDKPAAATLVLGYGGTFYYLHSASDHDLRSHKAPNLLRWEVMLNMKKEGFTFADFWGIDAERWPGVTAYKLGWGGKVVDYPPALDLITSPLFYYPFRMVQKIRGRF